MQHARYDCRPGNKYMSKIIYALLSMTYVLLFLIYMSSDRIRCRVGSDNFRRNTAQF